MKKLSQNTEVLTNININLQQQNELICRNTKNNYKRKKEKIKLMSSGDYRN